MNSKRIVELASVVAGASERVDMARKEVIELEDSLQMAKVSLNSAEMALEAAECDLAEAIKEMKA